MKAVTAATGQAHEECEAANATVSGLEAAGQTMHFRSAVLVELKVGDDFAAGDGGEAFIDLTVEVLREKADGAIAQGKLRAAGVLAAELAIAAPGVTADVVDALV